MHTLISRIIIFSLAFIVLSSCKAQPEPPKKVNRLPVVAGRFYPASKEELTKMLAGFFSQAEKSDVGDPLAVIVPHAGYPYSGLVAATTFRQISRDKQFKRIFLIGSSHTMYFNGASVYTGGDFITPLGSVPVDPVANELVSKSQVFNDTSQPHKDEHSLEVELPFLQYWLEKPFTIVPIIIGGESVETSKKLAEILKPYFNEDNLFVISTDFSHYPSYNDAVKSDGAMANAIFSNSSEKFLKTKNLCENSNTPNEVTAMCGWMSVLTLLHITEKMDNIKYTGIIYKNSGDSEYGDMDKVVGYYGICAYKKQQANTEVNFNLDDADKKALLKLARNTITEYLSKGEYTTPDLDKLSSNLLTHAGAFVTLTKNGELRGCIGNFSEADPLYKTVQEMAIAAATEDTRFMPVVSSEVPKLEIEISVLTPMKKIKSIDEIILGKHGIYIKKGMRGGTFLPQVATGTGWTKEEFLGHCAQDKAGIGWNGWKDADIYTYEALVFSEHNFR